MNRHIALSWVAFGAIGVIIVAFLLFLFTADFSGPPRILVPDSEILQPVLDSPEGKAFIARYPEYQASVLQDFYMARCCSVYLNYFPHSSNASITGQYDAGIQLHAHVSVSSDLKRKTVDSDMLLWCIAGEGGWTVKGDIIQNLQPVQSNCWSLGPPPKPADHDLITIASNTTVGKAYLSRYPENDVIIHRDHDINNGIKVTFTPKVSEPVEYVTRVAGFDRDITETYIVCSNGAYRYPDSPNFWSYFELENDCLQSVHDKFVVASETAQAKAFQEKYPKVRLHGLDSSSRFTVTGTESSIKYLYRDVYGNDALLIVLFKSGTTDIMNFQVQCGPKHLSTESGMNLDVSKFLQGTNCPLQ